MIIITLQGGYIYSNKLQNKNYQKGIQLGENSISNVTLSSNNMTFYEGYYFTQNDIYTNGGTSGSNPILYPQGSYGANYTFNYNEYNPEPILDWWAFEQDSNQQRSININGTETTIYFDNLLPVDNSIGWNIDSEQTDKITMRVSYYNTIKQEWEQLKKYTLYNSSNQDIKEIFPYYENNIDNSLIDSNIVLRLQDYTIEDTILDFEFIRKVSGEYAESDFINYSTYLVGDNTAISTTEINVEETFSGEYIKTYNNNLNNFISNPNNQYNNEQNQVDLDSNFDNVVKAIESGEKQAQNRFNWWKEQYNNLLSINQAEISGEISQLMNDLELGSGEKEIALAGLDVLNNNEWGDFIISWEAYSPNFTIKNQQVPIKANGQVIRTDNIDLIPSNQINFSQIERENETFKEVMKYARAFISFVIICAFMKNVWNTLLITLGISTQVYEKEQEGKKMQEYQEEKWKSQRDKQNYEDWLRRHKK